MKKRRESVRLGKIPGVRGERGGKLGGGETGDLQKFRDVYSLGMRKKFEKMTQKSDRENATRKSDTKMCDLEKFQGLG